MAKRIQEPSYRSGDVELVVTDSFIYEVTLYRIYKDRAECIDSQYYSTDKPIDKFKECKVDKKKGRDHVYMKSVTWVGAPMSYIESNGFKLVDKNEGKRKRKPSRKK